jgi:hypothetical protein
MEFNEHHKAALVHAASLTASGYHYSSRRERMTAHFMAAMIAGTGKNLNELALDNVQDQLVETALNLTDKLIVKLAENLYVEPSTEGEE